MMPITVLMSMKEMWILSVSFSLNNRKPTSQASYIEQINDESFYKQNRSVIIFL